MVSNYLFALTMGVVALILVYLDSLQTKTKTTKTTYIKVFMAASIISLITSEFYKSAISSGSSGTSVTQAAGSFTLPVSRQQILTGNPDF